jgi:hypothetical protein
VLVSFREGIAGMFPPPGQEALEFPRTKEVTKQERTPYDKRIILPDGISTRPLQIDTISPQTTPVKVPENLQVFSGKKPEKFKA